jgi:RimJ/RimL family protein N-acetyltransferase
MTPEQSVAHVQRIGEHFDEHGFGLWAVEVVDGAAFVGFVGLAVPAFEAPFTPCVEIGWRLARDAWGHGYATEAAHAALDYAFGPAALDEVVSFTTVTNAPSRAVMERLGMHRDPADDFDHPNLDAGHPLRPHVLYRIRAGELPPGD